MRSQHHTAHTHTTDLKPSIAPIEAPSSTPPPLTSSRERVESDNVEAPPHRCKSRGRRPTASRCHRLCRRRRRPRVSELRLLPSSCNQGSTDGARQPRHCRAQGSTDSAKTQGHRQCLPSEEEEEEGRASHLPGKMRSLPKGLTTNGRGPFATGAYDDKRSGW